MALIFIHRYRSYAIRMASTSIACCNLCKSVTFVGDEYLHPRTHLVVGDTYTYAS